MPKYISNSRFSDCWASVGNITFYHRNGQCYFRKKSVCKFPQTAGLIAVLEVHRRALAAWRALDHCVQIRWNEYAKTVPSHRSPFDKTTHITGHNLFVSAYHGFAQIGNEHIPEPMPCRAFPLFSVDVAGIGIIGESMLLCFKVKMPLEKEPSRYRLHTKIQLAAPGGGQRPGYMRMFIAKENCCDNECIIEVEIPDYKSLGGLDLPSYQMHCRFCLIDTITGYRNDWTIGKFMVSL